MHNQDGPLIAKTSFLFLLVAALASQHSHATPMSWTGPYAGVHLGATSMYSNHGALVDGLNFPDPALISTSAEGSTDSSGFSGGVQVGYNQAFALGQGRVQSVFGVVADYTYAGLLANRSATIDSDPSGVVNQSISSDWMGTVRLNGGLAVGPGHVYGTGGITLVNNSINNEACFPDLQCNSAVSGDYSYTSGVYGFGADYFVTSNITVGGTVLWSQANNLLQGTTAVDVDDEDVEDTLITFKNRTHVTNYMLYINYVFDMPE